MRPLFSLLLSLTLLAALAGCAENGPVALWDDMGEVDTPEVITLDQIEFDSPCNEEIQLERCLSMDDPNIGVTCDTATAILHFDADMWDLNTEWAEHNVDTFSELPDGKIVWIWKAVKPKWAECGCPDGCSAAQCNWEQNEDNSYSCTGDCAGTHCSHCTVELREAAEVQGIEID